MLRPFLNGSLSARKELREAAARQYQCRHSMAVYNKQDTEKEIFSALYASKLVSYAQGFAVLQRASDTFGWTSIWLRLHGCGEAVVLFAVFS